MKACETGSNPVPRTMLKLSRKSTLKKFKRVTERLGHDWEIVANEFFFHCKTCSFKWSVYYLTNTDLNSFKSCNDVVIERVMSD